MLRNRSCKRLIQRRLRYLEFCQQTLVIQRTSTQQTLHLFQFYCCTVFQCFHSLSQRPRKTTKSQQNTFAFSVSFSLLKPKQPNSVTHKRFDRVEVPQASDENSLSSLNRVQRAWIINLRWKEQWISISKRRWWCHTLTRHEKLKFTWQFFFSFCNYRRSPHGKESENKFLCSTVH
jgi:hypothetical protein